jgi:hypothetical protein
MRARARNLASSTARMHEKEFILKLIRTGDHSELGSSFAIAKLLRARRECSKLSYIIPKFAKYSFQKESREEIL